MPTYAHIATYDAPVEQVWSWYDSPGAFRRIMPEWEGIRPLEAGRLVDDATTRFRVSLGPLRPMWVARHYGVTDGNYKLIHFYQNEDWEMFDLTADPNELQSIYGRSEFAGIQSRLEKELKRLRAHYKVPEQDPENPRPNQRRNRQNNRKK